MDDLIFYTSNNCVTSHRPPTPPLSPVPVSLYCKKNCKTVKNVHTSDNMFGSLVYTVWLYSGAAVWHHEHIKHQCAAILLCCSDTHTHTHRSPTWQKTSTPFMLSTGTMLQIAFDSAAASAGFDSCETGNWFNCEEIENEQATLLWPRCFALIRVYKLCKANRVAVASYLDMRVGEVVNTSTGPV